MAFLCLFLHFLAPAQSHAAPPPVITVQPLDQTVVYGGTVTFSVTASSGTALSYQWYKDGLLFLDELLSGETRSTLVLNNADDPDEGLYFVKVSNAGGTVTTRKAQLTVVANSPPVANNDSYSTPEDVPLIISASGVLTNDSDVNGQALAAVVVTNVAQGSLGLNANGSFTYTPPSNYFGSVSFAYCASDGYPVLLEQNNSGGNKFEIKFDKPGSQSFRHGSVGGPAYHLSKVSLRLSRKSGAPNANLTFSIGTGKNSGPIAGSTFVITTASITNISDGVSFQDYTITYAAPVGPFVAGTTYCLNFDNAPNGSDVFVEISGSSTYANGTYYEGGDDKVKDMRFRIYETVLSNPATVTINVTPVNDAPVVANAIVPMLEDLSATIPVLSGASDAEGSPLTLTGASTTNGTAIVNGTNVVFTPATNFNGTTAFSYIVSDGALTSTGTVTVIVAPVPDAPVANNDAYTTPEAVLLTVPAPGVLANDLDGDADPLAAQLVSGVANGSLSLNANGAFTYTPNSNYYGSDSFTYRTFSGGNVILQESSFSHGKVEIKRDQKGAQSFQYGTAGAPSYTISKVVLYLSREATAPDTNLNFNIGTGANSGALSGTSVAIAPASITNTSSGDSFQPYEIVFATPVGPLTAGTTYYLNLECEASNGKRLWPDYDDQNNYSGGNYYKGGSLENRDMLFQLYGSTNAGSANTATVTINVTKVNDAPVANNDTYTVSEDSTLTVPMAGMLSTGIPGAGILANDTDADGDAMTAIILSDVAHGDLALNPNGSFTYTPDPDFNGPDSFTYRATDGTDPGNVALVTINVTPVSDALRFTSQQMTANGFELHVSGPDASTYVISASANLTDWTPIHTNYVTWGNLTFTDTDATNHPVRFYRVKTR